MHNFVLVHVVQRQHTSSQAGGNIAGAPAALWTGSHIACGVRLVNTELAWSILINDAQMPIAIDLTDAVVFGRVRRGLRLVNILDFS